MQVSIAITVALVTLFASVHYSESVLTYVEPLADGDVGIRGIAPQGTTGTVYTFDVTTANAYAITAQVPAGVLEIVTATSGAITIVSGQTVDTVASTTHVLTVTAGDGAGATGTITVTLTVLPIYFMSPQVCYDLPAYSAKGTVHTPAASGAFATITYAQTGTANSGYAVTTTTGLVANDAVVIATTTSAMVTTYITAVEPHGTPSTATQTVYFCVNGGCSCSSMSFSGAASISAGILTLLSALLLLKLK